MQLTTLSVSPRGGDNGARAVVMRRSIGGGWRHNVWEPATIVGNCSDENTFANGLYLDGAVHDTTVNRTYLFWGQCLEQCHPGGKGYALWQAPTFIMTTSDDGFITWSHTNLTAQYACSCAEPLPTQVSEHLIQPLSDPHPVHHLQLLREWHTTKRWRSLDHVWFFRRIHRLSRTDCEAWWQVCPFT